VLHQKIDEVIDVVLEYGVLNLKETLFHRVQLKKKTKNALQATLEANRGVSSELF